MYLEWGKTMEEPSITYPRVEKHQRVASEKLAENLWSKFKSLWSALVYIWNTYLACMITTDKDSRAKYTTWKSIYNKFFNDLWISSCMDNKKKWKFGTISKACKLIGDVGARWECEEKIMENFRDLIKDSYKDPELENFLIELWKKYLKNPSKENWLQKSKIMPPKWIPISPNPKQPKIIQKNYINN